MFAEVKKFPPWHVVPSIPSCKVRESVRGAIPPSFHLFHLLYFFSSLFSLFYNLGVHQPTCAGTNISCHSHITITKRDAVGHFYIFQAYFETNEFHQPVGEKKNEDLEKLSNVEFLSLCYFLFFE